MIRATQLALLLFLLTLTGVVLWLGFAAHGLLVHLDGVALRAQGIETKANATLINLDKGTAIWAASAKDQAGAVQDLATDAHGTLSQANLAIQSLNQSAQTLNGDLAALHTTADTATGVLAEATETLKVGKRTVARATPILEASEQAVDDLDALLKDEAIHKVLTSTAETSANFAGVSHDFKLVADKETADWLRPVPWWKQPIKKAGALIDITAAIGRNMP
jgi:hypothetical protein